MSAEITPKSWVQCINAAGTFGLLTEGAVYYVVRIALGVDDEGELHFGVVLAGFPEGGCFNPARFRPLGGHKAPEPAKAGEWLGETA